MVSNFGQTGTNWLIFVGPNLNQHADHPISGNSSPGQCLASDKPIELDGALGSFFFLFFI